eukprot:gene18648-26361_t
MKLLAAYVLLKLGGKESPSAEDITGVITSIGGEVDEAVLTTLLTDLEGKNINELLAKGEEDLKSCVGAAGPSGNAAAAPAAGGGSAPAAAAAPAKPKEEEVDALEGGMDMFGGG